MAVKLSKTLQHLVDQMQGGGFVYTCEGDRAKIEAVGYELETNPGMTQDGDPDFIATRLKQYDADANQSGNVNKTDGVDNVNESAQDSAIGSNNTEQQTQTAATAQTSQKVNTMFKIASVNVAAMPAPSRATAKYPFDQLEVGQSFFVPNHLSNKGDAAKTLASTISGKNTQYSEEIPGQTRTVRGKTLPARKQIRTFEGRRVLDGAEWGHPGEAGVAVIRTL